MTLRHLGNGVTFAFLEDGDAIWGHPECRSYHLVDLTSGEKHQLISRDPLHIEASLLCPLGTGAHGFIRNGKWVPA